MGGGGAGEVGFGEGLGYGDLGVDGSSLVVECGVVWEFGDQVVVATQGVEPEAVVGEDLDSCQSLLVGIGCWDGGDCFGDGLLFFGGDYFEFQGFAG